VYALSNAQEIKLFKKNIRLSYPDYEFYPLDNFLVILTEYRRDTYLTIIDKDFNSKVIFIPGYSSPIDIVQIKSGVYAIIPKGRDFYCLKQILPKVEELFCYSRNFIDKTLEIECSVRKFYQSITQDLNIGLFKIPREAYSLNEILFCGKRKFKGRLIKLNQNKKIVLKKDFNLSYKYFTPTKYGLYAKKDNDLVFIDLSGKEKVIEKNVKFVEMLRANVIHIKTKNGRDIYIYGKNIFKPDKNCRENYTYLHCEDNTVIDLKTVKRKPQNNQIDFSYQLQLETYAIHGDCG